MTHDWVWEIGKASSEANRQALGLLGWWDLIINNV